MTTKDTASLSITSSKMMLQPPPRLPPTMKMTSSRHSNSRCSRALSETSSYMFHQDDGCGEISSFAYSLKDLQDWASSNSLISRERGLDDEVPLPPPPPHLKTTKTTTTPTWSRTVPLQTFTDNKSVSTMDDSTIYTTNTVKREKRENQQRVAIEGYLPGLQNGEREQESSGAFHSGVDRDELQSMVSALTMDTLNKLYPSAASRSNPNYREKSMEKEASVLSCDASASAAFVVDPGFVVSSPPLSFENDDHESKNSTRSMAKNPSPPFKKYNKEGNVRSSSSHSSPPLPMQALRERALQKSRRPSTLNKNGSSNNTANDVHQNQKLAATDINTTNAEEPAIERQSRDHPTEKTVTIQDEPVQLVPASGESSRKANYYYQDHHLEAANLNMEEIDSTKRSRKPWYCWFLISSLPCGTRRVTEVDLTTPSAGSTSFSSAADQSGSSEERQGLNHSDDFEINSRCVSV